MYSALLQIINNSDSRYLTQDEEVKIRRYSESIPYRLDAARAVESREEELIRYTIEQMRVRYPRFETLHDRAWAKAYRDIQLVLRYAVQSMILDDPSVGEDKLYVWMRTIISSLGLTPQFVRDTYTYAWDGMKQRLSSTACGLLEPHMRRVIDVMSDFPEPATPMV